MEGHINAKAGEGMFDVKCPLLDCGLPLDDENINQALGTQEKIDSFAQRRLQH